MVKSKTENLIDELNKEFGDKAVLLSNQKPPDVIPFGIHSLDKMTGIGGIPRGLITEIYGAESNGKSSLCLSIVSSAQKLGLESAYIDMELALTPELAKQVGVDIDKLMVLRPATGEEAFSMVESLIEKGVKLVVVDSVSSLVPEDELEAEFDEQSIGLQARLMSKGMRKIIGCASANNAAIVFTNQIRDDIGKMGFGEKITTSGGRALRFYSALRFKVVRTGWITKDTEKVGMTINVTSMKNKLSVPQKTTSIQFFFGEGFDKDTDLLNYLVLDGTLELVGRTYYIGEESIGTKEKALEYIKTNNILGNE